MITGMEIAACQHLAVPSEVMQHIVNVESGYNPFAIGVVGGKLARQPKNLGEALATVHMLDKKGYNFSLGIAQVNRANLLKYGLATYRQAFDVCPNLTAGARILSQCYARSGNDWGRSFSCYYSGNFTTGFRDGYVQKIYDSMNDGAVIAGPSGAIPAISNALRLQAISSPLSAEMTDPRLTEDSARYRLAIRSALPARTEAAHVSRSTVAAAVMSDTHSSENTGAGTTNNAASLSNKIQEGQIASHATASRRVAFEPRIHSLGEAVQPQVLADDDQSATGSATKSSNPSIDRADLRQGVRDEAFVF